MAEYCLRWNNHQPNLVTVFSELLTAESLVDVTLAAEGQFIHAHRLVLSACSVYFKDLFGTNSFCKHPIVFLKDIRIEDLKTVIDFIYRGEVNVSQDRLQDVIKTAESLRIKGLADKPFNYDDYPSQARSQQHLSSSFSSQRSSLTDSREQVPSIDADDVNDESPPSSKKRKIIKQDSSESTQDSNHEPEDKGVSVDGKEVLKTTSEERSKTPTITIKEKIKEESNDTNNEYQENRAADAMLLLQGSSSEGGGDEVTPINNSREGAPPPIGPHGAPGVRGKRGVLQRQHGILPPTEEPPPSSDDRPPDPQGERESAPSPVSSSTLQYTSGDIFRSIPSKKHLQVPAVVVGQHEKSASFSSLFQQHQQPMLLQITKQRSQPEMSRCYSTGAPPTIKKQPSVLTHTTSSQEPMTLISMQVVKKDASSKSHMSTSGATSAISYSSPCSSNFLGTPLHLRPIQPKPTSEKEQLPMIHLTAVSDEDGIYSTRLPRAISEEPNMSRVQNIDYLTLGPAHQLTQSVSQDTVLDGGMAIIRHHSAAVTSSASQKLHVPKFSSVGSLSSATPSTSAAAHSPVLREGPALGCNFCWNSQDQQGRVQRRKTKYHCPACRTNLCIVPCFHEYHSQMTKVHDQQTAFCKVLTKTTTTIT